MERLRYEAWQNPWASEAIDDAVTEIERLRAEVERLRAELDVERTANRITENHNHFDCAAELSRLRCENERLAGGRREQ